MLPQVVESKFGQWPGFRNEGQKAPHVLPTFELFGLSARMRLNSKVEILTSFALLILNACL